MIVRTAQRADIPAILTLWNHIIRDTLITFNSVEKTETELQALLRERAECGHAFFVAENGGAVVGFGTYSQFRAGADYAHTLEHSIALDPAARGSGMGRNLLKELEKHAADAGHHSIFAGVSSANPEGRAFHAALGYREIATLPEVGFKWGQWLDLHLMQKILSPPGADH